jgi:hypothetical protein
MSRVRGGDSSAVKPAQEEGVFDVWLYLEAQPDDQWIEAFALAAEEAGVRIRHEPHAGRPSIAFSEQHRAINKVIAATDKIIEHANSRRQQMAAEERQYQAEQNSRDQEAVKIQDEIDRM